MTAKKVLPLPESAILSFILILYASYTMGQSIQIRVTVEGDNNKIKKELKEKICSATLNHLKTRFPDTELPQNCFQTISEANIHLNIDGIIDTKEGSLNLLLELRDIKEKVIIKQKSATLPLASAITKSGEEVINGTNKALDEMIPVGWSPPSHKEKIVKDEKQKVEKTQGEKQEIQQKPTTEMQNIKTTETQTAIIANARMLLIPVSEKDVLLKLDGKTIGRSPSGIFKNITIGQHKLEAEKQGFKEYSATIDIKPGENTDEVIRHDIFLENLSPEVVKKKKRQSKGKWWIWVTVASVLAVSGGATAAGILLYEKEESDTIKFPDY